MTPSDVVGLDQIAQAVLLMLLVWGVLRVVIDMVER